MNTKDTTTKHFFAAATAATVCEKRRNGKLLNDSQSDKRDEHLNTRITTNCLNSLQIFVTIESNRVVACASSDALYKR